MMRLQRYIQWVLCAAGAASILFFVGYVWTTSTRDSGATIFLLFLGLTALSPVAVWWWLSGRLQTLSARYVLLMAAAVIFGVGAFIYYDGLFVHLDPLNALGFLFFPPWQIGGLLLMFGVLRLSERRKKKA
jgi:hypothetical protein